MPALETLVSAAYSIFSSSSSRMKAAERSGAFILGLFRRCTEVKMCSMVMLGAGHVSSRAGGVPGTFQYHLK